jgi:hypothetical protein
MAKITKDLQKSTKSKKRQNSRKRSRATGAQAENSHIGKILIEERFL